MKKKLSVFFVMMFLNTFKHIGVLAVSVILIIVGAIWSKVCLYIGLAILLMNMIVALVTTIRAQRVANALVDAEPEFGEILERLSEDPKAFLAETMEDWEEKKKLHGEELLTLSDDDLFETVSMQNVEIVGDAENELDQLSGARRTVYILNTFDAEVQNGGLCQFFVNSSRAAAPFVSEALAAVGAEEHLTLFDTFVSENNIDTAQLDSFKVFSNRGFIRQTKRFDFDGFDDRYYELPALQDSVVAFIKANIHEF